MFEVILLILDFLELVVLGYILCILNIFIEKKFSGFKLGECGG